MLTALYYPHVTISPGLVKQFIGRAADFVTIQDSETVKILLSIRRAELALYTPSWLIERADMPRQW